MSGARLVDIGGSAALQPAAGDAGRPCFRRRQACAPALQPWPL